MRMSCSAVIVAAALAVGCGSRDDNVQTPPAQAPTAQAPAPAPAPAPAAAPAGRAGGAAAGGAQAGGRAGGAAGAQVSIEQHEAAMKQIATANAALGAALKASDVMAATAAGKTLATQFTLVEQFWTQRNKPDAVKIAQGARQGATTLAAATTIDAVKAAQPAVGGSCKMCHSVYREGDATAGYRIAASAGITQ